MNDAINHPNDHLSSLWAFVRR